MRTVVFTTDSRGDRPLGTWLRDLGFKLVEAGCEVTVTRATGPDASRMLEARGVEVFQAASAAEVPATSPVRAGARRFPEGGRADELS